MIEQGIYFALGCIVTALAALMFAPVFWRRAMRLTRQRLQLQVPLSMQEILAERDQLRAEFAVERLRVEQAMEAVQATKAQDMAEIGRLSVAAVAMDDRFTAKQRLEKGLQAEVERLERDAQERTTDESTLLVALHDAEARCDLWQDRAERARSRQMDLADENESHRTMIASLETRAMGLEMRLTDSHRASLGRSEAQEANLRGKLETAMEHAARHETAGVSLRRELDDAKAHLRQLEADLVEARASLDAARDREKTSHLQRGLMAEKAKHADRDLAERLDSIQTENAALREALAAIRRDAPGQPQAQDDAGLRESIHALGLAVAKLTRKARLQETTDGDADAGRDSARRYPADVV